MSTGTSLSPIGRGDALSASDLHLHPGAPGGPPAPELPPEDEQPPARTGIPHFPALEGLRGLAVAGVVLFHANFPWMRGGFLGVSTFFTLSGFLITSLLLAESRGTGAIDLRRFWLRRFRRLMPASLAALALVAVFGAVAADAVQQRNLAGDVLAALGYVANWRFLLSEQAYADIFGAASPVAHFWSLAIEEQFYLVMPLLSWLLLARWRLRRITFGAVLAVLAAASAALPFVAGLSGDAVYFNTATRAVELLAGGLLATVVFDRRVTVPLGTDRRAQVAVSGLGALALGASVALWTWAEQAGEASAWLYRGGLAGYSVLTAIVIVASIMPVGPVRWLLSLPPLRGLGAISYGVYLYHWPVFLWLDAHRTGLEEPALFGVRAAVTLAVSLVSYYLIETPIRRRSSGAAGARRPRPVWPAAPVVVAGLVAAVVAVTLAAPPPAIDIDRANAELASATNAGPPPEPVDVAKAEAPFPRAAFFGDSTAIMTGVGFGRWAASTGEAQVVGGAAHEGCGIGRGGERRDDEGNVIRISDGCNGWAEEYREVIEANQPNIAIVETGPWEVIDRRIDPSSPWVTLGDPGYDRFLLGEMVEAVDVLSAKGAVVVWLTTPPMGHVSDKAPKTGARDPARVRRLNELIGQLPGQRPGKVAVVDLGGWVAARGADDVRLRPDGYHFDPETSLEVSRSFLAPAVLEAYRTTWAKRAREGGGPAPDAAGGYRTRYRAVVLGDQAGAPVADAIAAWGKRTGALDVTVNLSPGCGSLDTQSRVQGGRAAATPPACRNAAFAALGAVATGRPDLVIVLPSAWDLRDARLVGGTTTASWTQPAFARAAAAQLRARTEAFNASGSVVLWVNAPVGDPAAKAAASSAQLLGATDAGRVLSFDRALVELSAAVPRGGAQRIDLAAWAARTLPAMRTAAALDAPSVTAVGDWLASQAWLQYDGGQKLRPPPTTAPPR